MGLLWICLELLSREPIMTICRNRIQFLSFISNCRKGLVKKFTNLFLKWLVRTILITEEFNMKRNLERGKLLREWSPIFWMISLKNWRLIISETSKLIVLLWLLKKALQLLFQLILRRIQTQLTTKHFHLLLGNSLLNRWCLRCNNNRQLICFPE